MRRAVSSAGRCCLSLQVIAPARVRSQAPARRPARPLTELDVPGSGHRKTACGRTNDRRRARPARLLAAARDRDGHLRLLQLTAVTPLLPGLHPPPRGSQVAMIEDGIPEEGTGVRALAALAAKGARDASRRAAGALCSARPRRQPDRQPRPANGCGASTGCRTDVIKAGLTCHHLG